MATGVNGPSGATAVRAAEEEQTRRLAFVITRPLLTVEMTAKGLPLIQKLAIRNAAVVTSLIPLLEFSLYCRALYTPTLKRKNVLDIDAVMITEYH